MHFILHYDVCAFLVSAFSLFCIHIKKGTKSKQNKIFVFIVLSMLFSSVADISSALADMSPDRYDRVSLYLINSLYLLAHLITPPLVCFYIYYLLGFGRKYNAKVPWSIAAPYALCVILILTNPVTKLLFFFDDDNAYTRGAGMPILYIINGLYVAVAAFKLFRYKKAITTGRFAMLVAYLILGLVGVAIQFLFPKLLIELFIESMAFLAVLISIENYDEMLNPGTRVLNRHALMKDLRKYMSSDTDFTLIVIRLKESSYIAGTFGIENMIEFEKRVVAYLKEFDSSVVYHHAGGSYALMCFDNEAVPSIMDSIVERFHKDWDVGRSSVQFGARISSARSPEDISSPDMVYIMLDSSIEVTVSNRHTVDVVPYSVYARRLDVDRALKRAVKNKSFEVYFQPICDLMDHKIHAAEALLRLHDADLGDISPDEFVPIAEKHGYIIEMGKFVAEQVLKFYKEQQLDRLGIDFIDINLSAVQCMSEGFVSSFKQIVKDSGIDMCHITLEVTESCLIHNRDAMHRLMADFSGNGVRFSLDDFGTGYSNFSYVLEYPFNIIKIDKSLLWSADVAMNGNRMFEGMMNMFRSMGIKTLVEGVENDSQKVLAEKNGCNYIQGFYFSEPLRAGRFIEYVKDFNS